MSETTPESGKKNAKHTIYAIFARTNLLTKKRLNRARENIC